MPSSAEFIKEGDKIFFFRNAMRRFNIRYLDNSFRNKSDVEN